MANINHFDFKNYRVFETEIAGRKLTVETGKMAQLANGSCLVRYGETAVLVYRHRIRKAARRHRLFPALR